MLSSTLAALSLLLTTAHSAQLPPAPIPRRVDQSINPRAEYIGGWAWSTSNTCTGAWSRSCDTSNNSCCPTGETCFTTGYGAYCCPTAVDCLNKLQTLPACADQSMEMYPWPWPPRYFCCSAGLIAVVPFSGSGGLCLPADQNVPASQILTASAQVGVGISRTSVPVVSATNPARTSRTVSNYTPSTPTPTFRSSSTSCTSNPCPAGTDTKSSSNSSQTLSNSAIGGIVGAVAFLALIIGYCCLKRSRNKSKMNVPPYPTIAPLPAKPMYVSTGQPYYTPQPARGTETSNTPAPHESANTQSLVSASAVPVSPLSSRVASPPPAYGASPAAQYGELHGQASPTAQHGELDGQVVGPGEQCGELHGQAVGPIELDGGSAVGARGQGWARTDGRESVTGRQEM
ncbi:hypothetical protein GMDG_00643 [Pseudogymnoascus destructans 20631-21]|uniref:Mid2 domain-containing protein n=2 Tax=Pseudogymnoascus destructans TaxID=655981 RepID=L8G713_PSED2|nr:hypothetical protein GMDG_00643 [Pseudogymnoascus destructans 20631-21]